MKSMMHKNLLRTIRKSLGRYIAIMAIIALGSGIFVGLLSSKTDMISTGQQYMDAQNMFDVRLISDYGWTDEELEHISALPGVSGIEGNQFLDVLGTTDQDGKENVYQIYTVPDSINQIRLTAGRLPQAPNECVLDDRRASENVLGTAFRISEHNKQDTLDLLNGDEFTIVGIGRTPLFMDMTRGNSALGNGAVAAFVYLPKEAVSMDYYTDIYLTLSGEEKAYTDAYNDKIDLWADKYEADVQQQAQNRFNRIRSDAEEEYADGLQEFQDGEKELQDARKELQDAYKQLTDGQKEIDDNRHTLEDGQQKLNDGRNTLMQKKQELEDGISQLAQKKKETDAELAEASEELDEKQKEIEENLPKAQDGLAQINDGLAQLEEGITQLEDGIHQLSQIDAEALRKQRSELESQKSALQAQKAELLDSVQKMEDGLEQINTNLPTAQASLLQIETKINELNVQIKTLEGLIAGGQNVDVNQSLLAQAQAGRNVLTGKQTELQAAITEMEKQKAVIDENLPKAKAGIEKINDGISQLNSGISQIDDALTQTEKLPELQQQLQELSAQREDLLKQQQELESAISAMQDGLRQISEGREQLKSGRQEADAQFASAEAELESGRQQIADAETELKTKAGDLAEGWEKLNDAQAELDDGFAQYQEEKPDAEQKIADGEKELQDAETELKDARQQIDDMAEPKVYLLGPGTNAGYISLDSNSDIVQGVSRVFPAFFLLVAALVCITTMTRMVEEERTQIGTLKALGYSSRSIISKYLIYAGSAAVLGCGIGVAVGSVVFPNIIWFAYKIMLSLEPVLSIEFNLPLCIAVVAAYTAVILLVTWYTCRRSLREVPAELIRPKAPTAGKKILLEYLPVWKKISFLNKVTLRNMFRYRQRLLMMLVGIGGCTALLVTGFGIGDSIQNIVSYQYEEVTQYDMQVQFSEGRNEQQQNRFLESMKNETDSIEFAYQTSVDVLKDGRMKSLYMIAADEGIEKVFDLHSGKTELTPPGKGEALLTVGFAEEMNVKVGDTLVAHAPDMEDVTVTVSGIFDNNINHYLLISPETLTEQWKDVPDPQLAFVTVQDSQDVHSVGAKISGQDDVTAVMISQDMADQVGSMLDAMDMIVVTVVICAGILAVIVLYNLTNINITERLREIATIKVLGFRANETAAYVFKENMLLSIMGCVLGLGFGKLLLNFVMSQIKVESIWFQSRITAGSILWSMIITMLMACIVDFILYFRLDKINMAEALKSVE